MTEAGKVWNDGRVETIMGNLLRAGVVLSAAVVSIGAVLYLSRYGSQPPHYRIFRGEPGDLRHLTDVVKFAFDKHSRGWIQVGLLLLIATPVARVIFSVYAFVRERDWLYVGITLIVLSILACSLFGAQL